MRYLVVGAGAIGTWLAHALARSGELVDLVDVEPQRVERLGRGVRLHGHRELDALQLGGSSWDSLRGPYDVAVLCVRPADMESALGDLRGGFPNLALVNAVGGLEAIQATREWPGEAMQAVVNCEVRTLPDGHVETAFSNFIWLGNLHRSLTPTMEDVQRDLGWAAPTLTTRVIEGIAWAKSAYCLEAGLPGLVRQAPLTFFADERCRQVAAAVVGQALAVAERHGIAPIGFDFFDPPLYRAHGAGQRHTLDVWIRNAWIRHEQFRVGSAYAFPDTCGLGHSLSPHSPNEELTTILKQFLQAASVVGVNGSMLHAYEDLATRASRGEPITLEAVQAIAEAA